jgi:hypothetical protein
MQGNLHVQFLGGQARATASGYPATLESHGRDDRLQTKDVDWIAVMVDGRQKFAGIRGAKCACMLASRNRCKKEPASK